VGRFINADVVMDPGAGNSVLQGNLFAYCGNDPVNYIDPTGSFLGLFKIKISLSVKLLSAIISAVISIVLGGITGGIVAFFRKKGAQEAAKVFTRTIITEVKRKLFITIAVSTASVLEIVNNLLDPGGWLAGLLDKSDGKKDGYWTFYI